MKTFLLKLLERVANAFREADYTAGRDAYLLSYGVTNALNAIKAKQDAEDRARTILPIGHEDAMSLTIGSAFHHDTPPRGGGSWRVTIYDASIPRFTVYADSSTRAAARAAQLVSALDGARRL